MRSKCLIHILEESLVWGDAILEYPRLKHLIGTRLLEDGLIQILEESGAILRVPTGRPGLMPYVSTPGSGESILESSRVVGPAWGIPYPGLSDAILEYPQDKKRARAREGEGEKGQGQRREKERKEWNY